MTWRIRWSMLLVLSMTTAAALGAEPPSHSIGDSIGQSIYGQRCAVCHEQQSIERMPTRDGLKQFAPEHIVAAMTTGIMRPNAVGLSNEEMRAVAQFLSAKPFGEQQAATPQSNLCTDRAAALNLDAPQWNGWGRDLENSRLQPTPGLTVSDLPKLELKWAYAYPGRTTYGQPTIVDDRVFVTSMVGQVSALDAATGCARWIYEAGAGVKSAVSVGKLPANAQSKFAAFFGDEKAFVHAVDAETGAGLWKVHVEEHVQARITGAPKLYDGRLYVPVSSLEEGASGNSKYECCTFRGSLVALDAATGKQLWKTYVITVLPKPTQKSKSGTQLYGPAGAAVWNSPTIDVKRRLIYIGTGNSYTDVPTDTHDAIMAFDLRTGARKWVNQVTPQDSFVVGCYGAANSHGNCPEDVGPDSDFGASVILKTLPGGKQILLAGQKSGVVYGLDPDANGKLLWQTQVGKGSALGGIEWGMAADAEQVYVAISDVIAKAADAQPGISALKIATGEKVWNVPTPPAACSWKGGRCARAQSAAVSAIPGAVFSGAYDGFVRAYSTKDGSVLWEFDTGQPFNAVNGITATGGNIDGGGPTIASGRVFMNSGYGSWSGGTGRVMLVFAVRGESRAAGSVD